MSDDADLIPEFVPALVVLLTHHADAKGAPLTQDEVLAIRDDAVCIMSPRSMVEAMAASRGYDDLDPEQVWEQWQELRAQ